MAERSASNIFMTHPRLPGNKPASTTREALDKIWGPKGWVEHVPTPAAVAPVTPAPIQTPATDTQAKPPVTTSGKKES